jgi:predicted DNA-binding protein
MPVINTGNRFAKGRPPAAHKRMVSDTFSVDEDVRAKLNALAQYVGKSKGTLVREGIEAVFAMYKAELEQMMQEEAEAAANGG